MSNMNYVNEWQSKMVNLDRQINPDMDLYVMKSSNASTALQFILNSLEMHCPDGYILAKAQLIEMVSPFGAPQKNG